MEGFIGRNKNRGSSVSSDNSRDAEEYFERIRKELQAIVVNGPIFPVAVVDSRINNIQNT